MALGDNIRNYYERLVIDALERDESVRERSPDEQADIACVALNHLPPRYYRHEVDMVFYLSPEEQGEMLAKVRQALKDAIHFVEESRGRDG